jgi:hypothetical protein
VSNTIATLSILSVHTIGEIINPNAFRVRVAPTLSDLEPEALPGCRRSDRVLVISNAFSGSYRAFFKRLVKAQASQFLVEIFGVEAREEVFVVIPSHGV